MMTLKRIWLWIDGYCWPHTTRWCQSCVEAKRDRTVAKYQKSYRRNYNMAYEVRRQRTR